MIRFLSTSLIVLITAVFAPASQTAEEAWYSIALHNKENDKNKKIKQVLEDRTSVFTECFGFY